MEKAADDLGRSPQERVQAEWMSLLPGQRQALFEEIVGALDATYTMMSVSLDEAMRLRLRGLLVQAREQAGICGDLVERLTNKLQLLVRTMKEQGQQLAELPVVLPLTRVNFRHGEARQAAFWHHLLHLVLPSSRCRYFLKLRTLGSTLSALTREFKVISREIADNTCVEPEHSWGELDHLHYDLNTCLRESIVVLKCFLRVMTEERFLALLQEFRGIPAATSDAPVGSLVGSKTAANLRAQLITPLPCPVKKA